MPATHDFDRRSIPTLDGVRALAFLLVLLSHAGNIGYSPPLKSGPTGVMLFFTLSGFLMAYHYLPGQMSMRYWLGFLIRRFFRVYPAFAIVTLLCWIAHQLHIHLSVWDDFDNDTLFSHWLLIKGTSIFWTIPVEIKFYLVFPILAVGLLALPFRLKWPILGAAWIILLALDIHGEHTALLPSLAYFIGGIATGCLAAGSTLQSYRHWNWNAITCVSLTGIAVLVYLGSGLVSTPIDKPLWLTSPLMAATVLGISISSGKIYRLFAHPIARFVGHISYSLYLIHWFVLHVIKEHLPLPIVVEWVINLIIIVSIAWTMYILVEKPCNRLGKMLSLKVLNYAPSPRH